MASRQADSRSNTPSPDLVAFGGMLYVSAKTASAYLVPPESVIVRRWSLRKPFLMISSMYSTR